MKDLFKYLVILSLNLFEKLIIFFSSMIIFPIIAKTIPKTIPWKVVKMHGKFIFIRDVTSVYPIFFSRLIDEKDIVGKNKLQALKLVHRAVKFDSVVSRNVEIINKKELPGSVATAQNRYIEIIQGIINKIQSMNKLLSVYAILTQYNGNLFAIISEMTMHIKSWKGRDLISFIIVIRF